LGKQYKSLYTPALYAEHAKECDHLHVQSVVNYACPLYNAHGNNKPYVGLCCACVDSWTDLRIYSSKNMHINEP